MRRLSAVEMAAFASLIGVLAAVAIPAFVRELHASRFVEPTEGLGRIGVAAVAFAEENQKFPDPAPLNPAVPPRGKKEADPPGAWDGPTWRALDFRPSPEGVPHAYSFAFDSSLSGKDPGPYFVAQARGDLDGDGILSTFEIRGFAKPGEKPAVAPGLYVESELE